MKNPIQKSGMSVCLPDMKDDIMYLDGGEVSEIERMIKDKYVAAHHGREISFLKTKNYWRTYIGSPRKEVTRRNRDDLIDYLYAYYKQQEISMSTIREVFERTQEYRQNILNRSENTIERDGREGSRDTALKVGRCDRKGLAYPQAATHDTGKRQG